MLCLKELYPDESVFLFSHFSCFCNIFFEGKMTLIWIVVSIQVNLIYYDESHFNRQTTQSSYKYNFTNGFQLYANPFKLKKSTISNNSSNKLCKVNKLEANTCTGRVHNRTEIQRTLRWILPALFALMFGFLNLHPVNIELMNVQ